MPGAGNMATSPVDPLTKNALDLRSEAEHVMLLYRNSRQPKPPGIGAAFLQ
jgi:hypothetical protein